MLDSKIPAWTIFLACDKTHVKARTDKLGGTSNASGTLETITKATADAIATLDISTKTTTDKLGPTKALESNISTPSARWDS